MELKTWAILVQIVVYDFPLIFIVAAYPWLCFHYKKQRKTEAAPRLRDIGHLSPVAVGTTSRPIQDSAAQQQSLPSVLPGKVALKIEKVRVRSRVSSRAFAVLSFLTGSLTVCWGPSQLYSTVQLYIEMDVPVVDEVCFILYAIQTVVDPVIFVIILDDLRKATRDTLKAWSGSAKTCFLP